MTNAARIADCRRGHAESGRCSPTSRDTRATVSEHRADEAQVLIAVLCDHAAIAPLIAGADAD